MSSRGHGAWQRQWRAGSERQKVWNAIDEVVARRSAGLPRHEVRRLLIEEIRRRGLSVPMEPMLEMRVDWILYGHNPIDKAKVSVEAVVGLLSVPRRLKRMFETAAAEHGRIPRDGYLVETSPEQSAQVVLTPAGRDKVESAEPVTLFAMRRFAYLRVTLDASSDDDASPVDVELAGDQIGTLLPTDAAPFVAELRAARDLGLVPFFHALRTKAAGAVRLDLPLPLPEQNRMPVTYENEAAHDDGDE